MYFIKTSSPYQPADCAGLCWRFDFVSDTFLSAERQFSEISRRNLGIKIEVFDEFGSNIDYTSKPGEMICSRAHPSVPLFLWGDANGNKLRSAYFDMFPGKYCLAPFCVYLVLNLSVEVWRQGDFITVNPQTGGLLILGRRSFSNYVKSSSLTFSVHSDGVLNPKGIRFGSAEIYSILDQFSSLVEDSICVGQRRPQESDERVILFLKMRKGAKFDQELMRRIKTAIRTSLSSRHVPEVIVEVKDIPVSKEVKLAPVLINKLLFNSVYE